MKENNPLNLKKECRTCDHHKTNDPHNLAYPNLVFCSYWIETISATHACSNYKCLTPQKQRIHVN